MSELALSPSDEGLFERKHFSVAFVHSFWPLFLAASTIEPSRRNISPNRNILQMFFGGCAAAFLPRPSSVRGVPYVARAGSSQSIHDTCDGHGHVIVHAPTAPLLLEAVRHPKHPEDLAQQEIRPLRARGATLVGMGRAHSSKTQPTKMKYRVMLHHKDALVATGPQGEPDPLCVLQPNQSGTSLLFCTSRFLPVALL